MSNALYDQARHRMVTADFDWMTIDLVLTVWSGVPDYNPTDETLNDILARGSGNILGHSLPVLDRSVDADGTVRTGQVVVPSVPIGAAATWLTLSERGDPPEVSELIYFVDTAHILPFTPNGLDMVIQPDWVVQQGWFRP